MQEFGKFNKVTDYLRIKLLLAPVTSTNPCLTPATLTTMSKSTGFLDNAGSVLLTNTTMSNALAVSNTVAKHVSLLTWILVSKDFPKTFDFNLFSTLSTVISTLSQHTKFLFNHSIVVHITPILLHLMNTSAMSIVLIKTVPCVIKDSQVKKDDHLFY